jgi:O-antigen ligase
MKGRSSYPDWMAGLVALLLLVYPALMLMVRGGMNGVFILALAVALIAWPFAGREEGLYTRRDVRRYVWAMFGLTLATFISESYWQEYSGRSYDAIARYWLAIPIFLWISGMRPHVLHVLQLAFPIGAITGFLLIENQGGGRYGISTLDQIHFGDIELMLGVLSLFCINWFGRDHAVLRVLKVAGFFAGIAASFASGSRGGWLALPVFIMIFLYFYRYRISIKMIAGAATLVAASLAVLFFFSATINQRLHDLKDDIRHFQAGNLDTSLGVRWQLYGAALEIFSAHPIVGVTPTGFARAMQPMMEAGKLTAEAARLGKGEVHNDVLSKTAGMGLFGLAAILALYLVPLQMFWKATQSVVSPVRRTGILGVAFVSGACIFGLTAEFLNLTMAAAFYAFTVAVLLAACNSFHGFAINKEIRGTHD